MPRTKFGSFGMTAAGEVATLRWRNRSPMSTLHLHPRGQAIRAAAGALLNAIGDRGLDGLISPGKKKMADTSPAIP